MNVLAIDQGTSATKAMVVDGEGTVVAQASVAVAVEHRADGGVEQDPGALLESVLAAGTAALAQAGAPVAALGLANQGETVLRWDRASGRPLGPAISWQDRRASRVTERLQAHGERLSELTGLALDPYFAAPKMAWLREREGQEGIVTTVDAWLNHQLTGELLTDAATASRTLLLDLDEGRWSAEACGLFGIDPRDLPAISDCAGALGRTDAFGAPLPLTGLAVDQQAALFGEGCLEAGEAKCTFGTGAFLLANAGAAPRRSRTGLAACVAWQLDGRRSYCLDGQVYTAAAAVDWLASLGLLGSAAELDGVAGGPPEERAPMFIPALSGLGAPFWAPAARAAFFGMTLASGREDLLRAVVWGIAAHVALLARAAAEEIPGGLSRLRADGGLARSRLLMQAQADLLQLPVERYPHPDATGLGIAALARLGAGLAGDAREALGTQAVGEVFEPAIEPARAEGYLERFADAARMVAGEDGDGGA